MTRREDLRDRRVGAGRSALPSLFICQDMSDTVKPMEANTYCQWDIQQFVWILQCHMRHGAQVFLTHRESASFHQSIAVDSHEPRTRMT